VGRAEFFRWEFATAWQAPASGRSFDEPNVTESKRLTRRRPQTFARRQQLPQVEAAAERGPLRLYDRADLPAGDSGLAAALRRHLGRVPPRGYHHVGAYLAPTPAVTERLRTLQARLRDGTRRASTLGYGPRYLHSTGQFHKGGAQSAASSS
jgi:glucose-6-phosphate isomerase/transaldolase/glucose-6-phosphate isomerase